MTAEARETEAKPSGVQTLQRGLDVIEAVAEGPVTLGELADKLGLTRSIAIDYAPAIRCVAVCPGTVDTPLLKDLFSQSPDPGLVLKECQEMHLAKRIASPLEIAEFVAYLASDKAAFITGQAFRIDGGLGITIAGSKK